MALLIVVCAIGAGIMDLHRTRVPMDVTGGWLVSWLVQSRETRFTIYDSTIHDLNF